MILIWFTVAKIWGEFKHEVRQESMKNLGAAIE